MPLYTMVTVSVSKILPKKRTKGTSGLSDIEKAKLASEKRMNMKERRRNLVTNLMKKKQLEAAKRARKKLEGEQRQEETKDS